MRALPLFLSFTLLLLAPAGAADPASLPQEVREIRSHRASKPPRIDGDLSDPVWQEAEPSSNMTQHYPDPGKSPSMQTTIRVLHDDQTLYIAAHCADPEPDKIVAALTRRDRNVESDWFYTEIDSRLDRRNAFYFAVNAAGVKMDGTYYDENNGSSDWDGVWEAEVRIVPDGWDVEMRIPLKLLRFRGGPDIRFGIDFRRWISRLAEWDMWQNISPESGQWVSRFGVLSNLDLPNQPFNLSIAPFLAFRPDLDSSPDRHGNSAFDVGADLRASIGSNFNLTLAANPDFGQTEVDQVVLNLTTVETYFPEKRPFFLEDMSLFQTPNFWSVNIGNGPRADLFYTRRIGRAPRLPDLGDDEDLLDQPPIPRIYGAAKFAGTTESRTSIGLIQAVTSEEDALVRDSSGKEMRRLAEPLTSFSILRLKQDFWENSSVGLMATSTATADQGAALTGGTDLQLEFADGSYHFSALTYWSYLTEERYPWQDSYTRAMLQRDGPLGFGADVLFEKKAGESFVGAVEGVFRTTTLALDDLGYLDRPNLLAGMAWAQYHYLKPLGPIARIYVNAIGWLKGNTTDWLNVGHGFGLNGNLSFTNNWWATAYFGATPGFCDDRETHSGGAAAFCTRSWLLDGEISMGSDTRQPVSGTLDFDLRSTERGMGANLYLDLLFNPHPRLQLEVIPHYQQTAGSVRWIDSISTAAADQYVFGEQKSELWDVTFRGTFTFTPTLTFQAYFQVFLATVDYGTKYGPAAAQGGRIWVKDLAESKSIPDRYDYTSSNFNFSAVLRWEYAPGSVAYLVYTGAFGRSADLADFRFGDVFSDLLSAGGSHVLLLKISYFWG